MCFNLLKTVLLPSTILNYSIILYVFLSVFGLHWLKAWEHCSCTQNITKFHIAKLIYYQHILSFLQQTSRRSWQIFSQSYWTAQRRSKASTTLPRSPAIQPWSCLNGSTASCPPWGGCPLKEDELGGTFPPITPACSGPRSMDLFNPRLPLISRGHLLLAVTPLLPICCYSFYHYNYNFAVILNKTLEEEEVGLDCWKEYDLRDTKSKQWHFCGKRRPSTLLQLCKNPVWVFHSSLLLL